jgi:hypothetical protein
MSLGVFIFLRSFWTDEERAKRKLTAGYSRLMCKNKELKLKTLVN